MTNRIIRVPNSPGREEDGFRVLHEKQEYATYPDDSSFRLWFSNIPWRYESHYHSAVEIVLTLKGTVEYKVEGTKYSVNENDVIIIPPGMQHELSMDGQSSRYLFLFEPDVLLEMRDIKRLEEEGAIKCWHGKEVPDKIYKSRRQEAGEAPCVWEQ